MHHQLLSVWKRLTAPNSAVTGPVDRRLARTVSGIHLVLLLFGMLCGVIVLLTNSVAMLSGTFKAVLLLGFNYKLSRSKHFRIAALITIIYINGQVLGQIFLLTPLQAQMLVPFLLLPIVLMTVVTSRNTIIIAVLINLIALTHYVTSREMATTEALASALPVAIVTIAIMLVDAQRRNLEKARLKEVLETESNLRSILETSFQATVVLQEDIIQDVNKGFYDLFDVAPAHTHYNSIANFLKTENEREPFDIGNIERGATVQVSGQRHNGSWFDAEIVVQDRTHHGEEATILAVRNITEKKRTALALQQAQRLDSLGMLSGGIAHDFNNLLTGIMSQLSLAQIKMPKDTAAAVHLKKSAATAKRASDLTKQLLAYAGKGNAATKTFDIQPLIQECIKLVIANNETSATFQNMGYNAPLPIEADLGQIQQVLLNLFINASEAIGPSGGEVYVAARPFDATEGSKQPVAGWVGEPLESRRYIELSVRDTGIGMDAKTRTRIFEPFFTTKSSGNGIGLAATLGAIRTHHGAIQTVSAPGEGTTFYVYLPLATGDGATNEVENQKLGSIAHTGLTVLAIDDQPEILDSIASILALHDNRVLCAPTGERGLAMLWENRAKLDLIILDMQMPGMNGEQTFQQIRNVVDIPVLISSGYSTTDEITRLLAEPDVTFLQKPYDAIGLASAVEVTFNSTDIESIDDKVERLEQ